VEVGKKIRARGFEKAGGENSRGEESKEGGDLRQTAKASAVQVSCN